MIGIGLHIGNRVIGGSIDAQAQAHYNRVIADGGVVPAGVSGTNAFFNAVKTIYGTTDITTAVSVGVDAHYLGYKLGAGAGATSGQAVQKLYSCAGSSGDVVQTTAASQPLLLAHSGASSDNYWFGSGVSANYVSTPNSTATTFNGDFELEFWLQNFSTANTSVLASKRGSSGFVIYINASSGIISLEPFGAVDSTVGISNDFNGWIKVTKTSTEIKYYTGTNSSTPTYTQLGATMTGSFGNPGANTDIFGIGGIYNTTTLSYFPVLGKILRVRKANSIGGTPVVDFNPSTYNASTSQTQWTSTTGEVWTINTGTATTGYKGVLVDRTEVQGDGIDDKLNSGVLSSVSTFTRYVSLNPFQRTGFGVLVSGDNSLNTALYKDSSAIRIYNGGTGVGALSFTSPQSHLLALFTADYNTSNSKATINNGTDATGTIGDNASTAINVFSDNTYAGNGMISTIISCRTVNNTSQKTSMYNYIRSINNNAF